MRLDRLVLIAILMVLPTAFWVGSTSYDPIKLTLLALAVAVWLGNLAWRLWKGRPLPRPPAWLLAAGGSLLVIMAISAWHAHHTGLVVRTILLTMLWLAVVFQTAVVVDSTSRMKSLLAAAVIAGVGVSLYALAQIAGLLPGAPVSSGFPPGISTLGNQNYVSGLAAVLLWPSVILWDQRSTWRRTAAVVATVVFIVTIVLAKASGPLFGVIGSFFLVMPAVILTRGGQTRVVPLVLGSSLLLGAVLGGWLLTEAVRPPPVTVDEPLSLQRKVFLDNHGALRRLNWLVARDMFRASPLTGSGAGNYAALWPVTRARLFTDPDIIGLEGHEPLAVRAHNEVFQFLGETGLVGGAWLLVCGGAGAWFWRRRWLALPADPAPTPFLMLSAAVMAAGIHASVSFPLHLPATALMMAMVVGLLMSPAFAGAEFQPSRWRGPRFLALVPAGLALFLTVGSLREFVGDLSLATGQRYFAAGQWAPAEDHLSRGVTLSRWPGLGHLYFGLNLMAKGNPEAAREQLTTGLAERPSFEGYLALAEISIDQGNFAEADRNLTIVDNCEPVMAFRSQAAYLRGLAALRQGNHDRARLRLGELLKTDPENQRACLALGYMEVLEGQPERGRIYYQRALDIIDRKLQQSGQEQSLEFRGSSVRLRQHRQTAVKALESLR